MRTRGSIVEGTHRKQINGIRDARVPVGQHAHGSRTGVIILRVEQGIEESRLNDVERFISPKCFEQVVFVAGILRVEVLTQASRAGITSFAPRSLRTRLVFCRVQSSGSFK